MRTFTNKNLRLIISLRLKACLRLKCKMYTEDKFKFEGCGLARGCSGNFFILLSVFFPHEPDKCTEN